MVTKPQESVYLTPSAECMQQEQNENNQHVVDWHPTELKKTEASHRGEAYCERPRIFSNLGRFALWKELAFHSLTPNATLHRSFLRALCLKTSQR